MSGTTAAPAPSRTRPADEITVTGFITAPELDRKVLSERVDPLEASHDHVAEPARSVVIVASRPRHQGPCPPPQGVHRLVEILAPGRQRFAPILPPADHLVGLETSETLDQQVRRDPRQAYHQLAVAPWSLEQFSHDEQRPALAHDVEGSRQSAVLERRTSRLGV